MKGDAIAVLLSTKAIGWRFDRCSCFRYYEISGISKVQNSSAEPKVLLYPHQSPGHYHRGGHFRNPGS